MRDGREPYDVIVVGGGHAGCEAAAAAARLGARTLLLTHKRATIGEMSCNPAIGGLGKGHLVREIDALDGVMGRAIDRAGIQFRMLNRSKGPAVRGPRAQADRKLYRQAMAAIAGRDPRPRHRRGCRRGSAARSRRPRLRRRSRRRQADPRPARVVLTTGTFLRGLIHIGEEKIPAGRVGEAPSLGLSRTLSRCGFALGRLKTGTPPRLDGRTIDWRRARRAAGRRPAGAVLVPDRRHHHAADRLPHHRRRRPATHAVIRANLHRSPLYSRPDHRRRAALLPVDRGQGRALRRARAAPDFPRAGGARRRHGLSERHLDLAAARRAGGAAADHPRAGTAP